MADPGRRSSRACGAGQPVRARVVGRARAGAAVRVGRIAGAVALGVIVAAGPGAGTATPAWADAAVPAPVRFEAGSGTALELGDDRRYLDTIELAPRGDGLLVVNELDLESYVTGVAEMPGRWHTEALKAQAVAARTYAWYAIVHGGPGAYDICPTVACQVFRGAGTVLDDPDGQRWAAAVEATAGQVLVDGAGEPILARYFSTSGGRTYANEEAFPASGPRPYLVAIDDPYDAASPYHRWTARFTRDQWDAIVARGDTLGAVGPVADVERVGAVDDPGATIRVTGEDGTVVEVGARDLASFVSRMAVALFPDGFPGPRADGLRPLPSAVPSSRFAPEVTDTEVVLHGQGWGHGVGMGQYGALGRARQGHTYDEILAAYYAGIEPATVPDLPERIRVGFDTGDEVAVAADGPFRIVADGEVLEGRALGRWRVTRSAGGLVLHPPPGHDQPLEVSPARLVDDVTGGSAVVVEVDVNKPVLLHLEVADAVGTTLLERPLGVAEPGTHAATWRFEAADGGEVAPGTYRVALHAEDASGAEAGAAIEVEVPASVGGRDDGGQAAPGEQATAGATARVRTVLLATAAVAVLVVGARLTRRRA